LRAVAIQTNNAMDSTNSQQHEENSAPVEFNSNELRVGTVNPDPISYNTLSSLSLFPNLGSSVISYFITFLSLFYHFSFAYIVQNSGKTRKEKAKTTIRSQKHGCCSTCKLEGQKRQKEATRRIKVSFNDLYSNNYH
jgi:hypothetical protein